MTTDAWAKQMVDEALKRTKEREEAAEISVITDTGDAIHLRMTDTGQLKRAPKPGLPELIINDADPTATAKEVAAMFAQGCEFLFNGYAPVRIAVEAGHMPRALEVTTIPCASWRTSFAIRPSCAVASRGSSGSPFRSAKTSPRYI